MTLRYHPGEIAVQYQAGVLEPSDLESSGIQSHIDDRARRFLPEQSWAVLASADSHGRMWASVIHGRPGFISVTDSHSLSVAATPPADDPLFDHDLEERPVGMLVLDMQTRRRMRFNGNAHMTPEQSLLMTTTEVYGNCPKYIQRREFIGIGTDLPGKRAIDQSLTQAQCDWVSRSDTFFIATIHQHAGADASHRGGTPGFVQVVNTRQLLVPDYSGNNMFQTLGNLLLNPRAGLLFIEFESGNVLQLTGSTELVWEVSQLEELPGAQRAIRFHIEEIQEVPHQFPIKWRLLDYSPFNPPI